MCLDRQVGQKKIGSITQQRPMRETRARNPNATKGRSKLMFRMVKKKKKIRKHGKEAFLFQGLLQGPPCSLESSCPVTMTLFLSSSNHCLFLTLLSYSYTRIKKATAQVPILQISKWQNLKNYKNSDYVRDWKTKILVQSSSFHCQSAMLLSFLK